MAPGCRAHPGWELGETRRRPKQFNDDVGPLFDWYFSGDTEYQVPSGRMVLKVSPESAELIRELFETTGALVVGRRHFDVAGAWGGRHPMDVPVFVVTLPPI